MFGKLKEKLKGWIKKTKEEEPEVEETTKEVKEEVKKETSKAAKPRLEKKAKPEVKESKKTKDIPDHEEEKPEEIITDIVEETQEEIEDTKEEVNEQSSEESKVEQQTVDTKEPVVEEEEAVEPRLEKKGFFSRFKKSLTEEKFDELYEELGMILLQHNVAYEAVDAIKDNLKKQLVGKSLSSVNLAEELEDAIEKLLINPPNFLDLVKKGLEEKKPFVILFSGINGSGKTTTIAKMAHYLKKEGLSVCLAAADTFRAASIEQIGQHAEKLDVPLIKKDYGSDPASVGFDAVNYAKKNNIDVVLIDTAGRMQNKDSLMKEIEKISRVNNPDMKIFLGESITGNDATQQAKAFNEAINLTGVILSKADVDEQGGTAISVAHVTGKPILFLGTGQTYDDLEVFDKKKLIKKLGLS